MARLGVVVAAILLCCGGCGSGGPLRERIQGLRLDAPKQWSVHRLGSYCHGRVGPGLLITNIPNHTFTHGATVSGECTNAWRVSDLPDDYILIDISRFGARPPIRSVPNKRSFPIKDSEIRPTSFPRLRALNFWNGDRDFTIRVWTGSGASQDDRAKIIKLVQSIRPSN